MRGWRMVSVGRVAPRALPVLLCALSAHAVVYRSLTPEDELHDYVGAYQAVVYGLSALALLTVLAVAAGAAGRLRRGVRAVPAEGPPVLAVAAWLAPAALVALAVQESVERTLAAGAVQPPALSLGSWALALVAVLAAAGVLAAAERACVRLVVEALGSDVTPPPAGCRRAGRRPASPPSRRRANVLAERLGLRGPPPVAV